jgi:DNA-binding CsgD family transcriptional regulator
MAWHTREEWCSLFEAIDACHTINDLGALTVTLPVLGCVNGSVQEVSYAGTSSRLGRQFVSGSLEMGVRQYITNFDKISVSLLGGDECLYLMASRIDRAIAFGFDPRSIWRGFHIRNVLTMRIDCGDETDLYFTFNRLTDKPDFDDSDMQYAGQLFSMLSATSRRLYTEERLYKSVLHGVELSGQALGVVGRGERSYQLSRVNVRRPGDWRSFKSSAKKTLWAECDPADDAVVYVSPSDATFDKARLTPAERAVAKLAALGNSNKDIARLQSLSVYTVENHLKSVYRKLDIQGRGKLAQTLLFGH